MHFSPLSYAPPSRPGLSAALEDLLRHADGRPVTFGGIIDALGERGHGVLVLLLAFPFLLPTPPGFSTPAGLAIGFLAVSLMSGRRPFFPEFVRRRELSYATLERIVRVTERLFKKVERLVKPRWSVLTAPGFRHAAGLSLASLAFLLALPIPIPWNNGPPAIGILILGLGLLERDGVMVLVGHVYNLLLWVALVLLGDFLWEMGRRVIEKLG